MLPSNDFKGSHYKCFGCLHVTSTNNCTNYSNKEKKLKSNNLKGGREKEEKMGPKNTFFFVLVLVALMTKQAQSAQHVVGGSQGWDASTDFNSWVSDKTFKVGDQLGM